MSALERPGPGSLVFERMADDRGLLLGGATLVLQVANPAVGAGVEQHSNFQADPWPRLWATLTSLVTIVYGTPQQAAGEVERLRVWHRSIRGVDRQGRSYSALSPAPWAWVHGTLAWSVIRLNDIFETPFTPAEREQYWREWLQVGRLLGVRDGDLPATWTGFERLVAQAANHQLEDNQSVRDVIAAISVLPPPSALRRLRPFWTGLVGRPVGGISRAVTIAALPPELAQRLHVGLTPREERRLRRFIRAVAGARRALPPVVRPGPGAVLIRRRARRRWDATSAATPSVGLSEVGR